MAAAVDGEVERSPAGSDRRHVPHREMRHLRGRLQLRHHGQVCCNTWQIETLLIIFIQVALRGEEPREEAAGVSGDVLPQARAGGAGQGHHRGRGDVRDALQGAATHQLMV